MPDDGSPEDSDESDMRCYKEEGETLTFSLWNGAGDRGAGGGDGAHRRAQAVHRVRPRHRSRVRHPGSRIDRADRLT